MLPAGKTSAKCAQQRPNTDFVHPVHTHPLAEHAARRQAFTTGLVVLDAVEHGGAGQKRGNRIGRDYAVALVGRGDQMAAVFYDDVRPGIIQDVVVGHGELPCGRLDLRLQFNNVQSLDGVVDGYRSRGHSGAESDHQHIGRILRQHHRQVAEDALHGHVLGRGRKRTPCC